MNRQLISKIEKIMLSDAEEDKFLSFATFLFGCSKIYFILIYIRNLLYKLNFLKSRRLPCFVISIGNITAGGTGKTPMTMYVARLVEKSGYKPVIVTRGYKGSYKNGPAVVSNGSDFFMTVEESGDEACMMAGELKIPVIVGKKRYNAGLLAIKEFRPDVIILDDGFQHIALERDLNLLLCDFKNPLGNGHLIPRGRLREPAQGFLRSDAVILTRSDRRDEKDKLEKPDFLKNKPSFETCHSPYIVKHVNYSGKPELHFYPENEAIEPKISGFLFSAIADNDDFRLTCKKIGLNIKGFSAFLDHHGYTRKDLETIYVKYIESNADYLVTTQKDYVKIREMMPDNFPLIIIGIKIKFNNLEHKNTFDTLIESSLNKYKNVNPR